MVTLEPLEIHHLQVTLFFFLFYFHGIVKSSDTPIKRLEMFATISKKQNSKDIYLTHI